MSVELQEAPVFRLDLAIARNWASPLFLMAVLKGANLRLLAHKFR